VLDTGLGSSSNDWGVVRIGTIVLEHKLVTAFKFFLIMSAGWDWEVLEVLEGWGGWVCLLGIPFLALRC